jgi:hypothetical protein
MGDPLHLAKLKEGIEAWNKWRKNNPKINLYVTEADLAEANLDGFAKSRKTRF